MIRHSANTLPRMENDESPKLLALTTTFGLHVLKVTSYGCFDEDDQPRWSTACRDGWSVERAEILWWVYADEARDLLEALPIAKTANVA
ncbi:hypothetical protein ACI77O_12305 [Pseudomonas tritici]|uniref:hypothetical protein n=1 Tax=Pseudomonas tritici TaxID=2745518 RepID=UPI00387A8805